MSVLTAHVALVSESPSVSFSDLSQVAAALQKQASRDFSPLWQVNATVDAFDRLESVPIDYWPVILMDDIKEPGAAGYHTDDQGQPFALVQIDDSWPLTSSHEALEMLADPFGNRTIAGAPPPGSPAPVSSLKRVSYLVEVCDPCEAAQFGYTVNGILLSDFITHHYYDPRKKSSAEYSFEGNIEAPHDVLEGGYVSFGNPVDNHWYQIVVENGQKLLRDLGVISATKGKSLREMVDHMVREAKREENYRTMPALAAKAAAAGVSPFADTTKVRAESLRKFVKGLK